LSQGLKAAGISQEALSQGRLQNPVESARVAALIQGPGSAAPAGQAIADAQFNNFMRAVAQGTNQLQLEREYGVDYVRQNLPKIREFLRSQGVNPPQVFSTQAPVTEPTPAVTPTPAVEPAPTVQSQQGPGKTATGRIRIPGVSNIDDMPEAQYQKELANYNTLKQNRYADLTKDTATQARGGQRVFEVSQQIHDVASSPLLSPIFALFEKGNPAGIFGQMLESQGLSSTLAEMRKYVRSARLSQGEKTEALTKLNQLENLMGSLQTEMQNAIINPSNLRTEYEKTSLPNLKNTQDAFLRGIRYIANEGLYKYENQFALQKAGSSPDFDPNFWPANPEYSKVVERAAKRRQAIVGTPATQDRPAFMRGSIHDVITKEEKPEKSEKSQGTQRKRMTAQELRELANKQD